MFYAKQNFPAIFDLHVRKPMKRYHFPTFTFSLMNVLIYVDIGQGIFKGKFEMKNKIKLCGFSYT